MSGQEERLPYPATAAARSNLGIARLPVSILLDQVRSLYNVGAFFRIADAAGLSRLYLIGITGHPPNRALAKTALGAQETVSWEHHWDLAPALQRIREEGCEMAAIETSVRSVDLFEWQPRFPLCVVFGHEIEGIRRELSEQCDVHVCIPMLGRKHSLNVAVAGGIVAYELLRKYRELTKAALRAG
ncbi:MAG TPA: TrmH family RNA methyltransferase [Bryobacterales bacterium]|jgi:23S rRNA (guanosine2251-2'-O)-methyltransferase|nr:TrmH family RNA methyltransferase [Bryobacterales bacterium]